MRESTAARRGRAEAIVRTLGSFYPDARIELHYTTPWELLVAVVLSAQCTDRRVNLITPALFARYPTVGDYAALKPSALYPLVRTCGLYRNKAKSIVGAARAIVERHHGMVPTRRADLRELPGVGAKSAGVITLHISGGEPAFPVDTHVARLARRMGLSRAFIPERIEGDLQRLLPVVAWGQAHQLLVWHGRRICKARTPHCGGCPVRDLCPKIGVSGS
jgi:endonuclease-3